MKSHEYPFVTQALVIVMTETGYYAISNGMFIDHQELYYSPYKMLLEYQNINRNIHVAFITKPMLEADALRIVSCYLHSMAIENPPRPLLVVKHKDNNQVFLTPPVRHKSKSVMSKTSEKVVANAQVGATTVIGLVFGTAHFVLQSSADLVAHSEAHIVKAINSHQDSVEEIIKARRAKTKELQNKVLEVPARIKQNSEAIKDKILKPKQEEDVKLKTA